MEESFVQGTFRRTMNRLGNYMYFLSGKQMTRANGEQQVILINEYLQPTKNLQERFKESENINACKLGLPDLTITKVLSSMQKKSSSDSIICEGTAFGEKVIVKVSFESHDPEYDNSLQIESEIYEKIVPLLSVHTPNLMPFLARQACDHFLTTYEAFRKTMGNKNVLLQFEREMLRKDMREMYNLDKLQLLVTKKAKGMNLGDLLKSEKLPLEKDELVRFTEDILLQIAYTLVIFDDFGLMHHDLHAGNVFVEKLPIPLHYSINIGEKTIIRNINYFVQIYDFDHSMKVETKFSDTILQNTLLDNDFCARFGECNKFNRNMDWFTILESMFSVKPSLPLISDLVEEKLLHGTYQDRYLAFRGRPCTCPGDFDCETCTQINLETENLIVSPYLYLLQNYKSCTTLCKPTFSRPSTQSGQNIF
jgi:hypothetical protein